MCSHDVYKFKVGDTVRFVFGQLTNASDYDGDPGVNVDIDGFYNSIPLEMVALNNDRRLASNAFVVTRVDRTGVYLSAPLSANRVAHFGWPSCCLTLVNTAVAPQDMDIDSIF